MPDRQRTQVRVAPVAMEEGHFSWPRHGFNFQPIFLFKTNYRGDSPALFMIVTATIYNNLLSRFSFLPFLH